jgi:hypothetical protein
MPDVSLLKKIKKPEDRIQQIKAHIVRKAFSLDNLNDLIQRVDMPVLKNMLGTNLSLTSAKKKQSVTVEDLEATFVEDVPQRGVIYKIEGLIPIRSAQQLGSGLGSTFAYARYGPHKVPMTLSEWIVYNYKKKFTQPVVLPYKMLVSQLLGYIQRRVPEMYPVVLPPMLTPTRCYTLSAYNLLRALPYETLLDFHNDKEYFLSEAPYIKVTHRNLMHWYRQPALIVQNAGFGIMKQAGLGVKRCGLGGAGDHSAVTIVLQSPPQFGPSLSFTIEGVPTLGEFTEFSAFGPLAFRELCDMNVRKVSVDTLNDEKLKKYQKIYKFVGYSLEQMSKKLVPRYSQVYPSGLDGTWLMRNAELAQTVRRLQADGHYPLAELVASLAHTVQEFEKSKRTATEGKVIDTIEEIRKKAITIPQRAYEEAYGEVPRLKEAYNIISNVIKKHYTVMDEGLYNKFLNSIMSDIVEMGLGAFMGFEEYERIRFVKDRMKLFWKERVRKTMETIARLTEIIKARKAEEKRITEKEREKISEVADEALIEIRGLVPVATELKEEKEEQAILVANVNELKREIESKH